MTSKAMIAWSAVNTVLIIVVALLLLVWLPSRMEKKIAGLSFGVGDRTTVVFVRGKNEGLGSPEVTISADKEMGTSIRTADNSGYVSIRSSRGGQVLYLAGTKSAVMIADSVAGLGTAGITIAGEEHAAVSLGMDEKGAGFLELRDKTGKVLWRAP